MALMRSRGTATVAAITAAVAVAFAGGGIGLWAAVTDDRSVAGAVVNGTAVVAFAVVGAIVAAARPRNLIGWAMLAGGAAWAAGDSAVAVAHHGIVTHPGAVAGASAYAIAGSGVRAIGWYLITVAVPVLFPTGRVLGPRWRWLYPALVVIAVGSVLDPLTDPQADLTDLEGWRNPIDLGTAGHAISSLAFLSHVPFAAVVTVAAIVQLVQRWRRGDALMRQQLLLLASAAGAALVAVPIAFASQDSSVSIWIFGAAALPLPVAIGFAVLARGLYDLRTAANRTLVWVTLSAIVAVAYALVIAGIGGMLHVDRHVSWLPWVAAAVVAISFAPLRDSLQRAINRLTYGRWDEPYDVLAALGQRVEGSADIGRLLADVAAELRALGLRDVAIVDLDGTVLAGTPCTHDDVVEMRLGAYGDTVGALRYRPPVTPMRSRDRQLLDDLAGHLGGVLAAQQLTTDLTIARERLVLAREEERRRLRRDLHDGLGPALAGHLLRLDVIAARVAGNGETAADVDSLREDLRATVADVRRVVEGLRPPALDELGLCGAIQQVTQRLSSGTPTTVVVEADGLPPLPAAVEVAAFRIVTEAVTNVVRHAGATTCRAVLSSAHGRLRIDVTDDGRGFARDGQPPAGHGLQTMRERAEELRGRLWVSSAEGAGLSLSAELPLPPAQRQASAPASSPSKAMST
jgi:signal transduction histidine kinase